VKNGKDDGTAAQAGSDPNGISLAGNQVAKVLTLVPEPLPPRLIVQVRTRPASAADSSGHGSSSIRPCREANLLGADLLPDFTRVALACGAALSSPGASVGSANVTPTELANAIAVLADPALVELLDASSPPCVPPTDIFESMKLVAGGVTHQNSTTMCDNAPVKAARDLIYQLGDKYLPPLTR
jgi:hypothetical protein